MSDVKGDVEGDFKGTIKFQIPAPSGGSWHADLLKEANRDNVAGPAVVTSLVGQGALLLKQAEGSVSLSPDALRGHLYLKDGATLTLQGGGPILVSYRRP